MIDEFTVIEQGKAILTKRSGAAAFQGCARGSANLPMSLPGVVNTRQDGVVELLIDGGEKDCLAAVESHRPEAVASETLSLEEIFLTALKLGRNGP